MHVLQFRSVLVSITKFINAKLCFSVSYCRKIWQLRVMTFLSGYIANLLSTVACLCYIRLTTVVTDDAALPLPI